MNAPEVLLILTLVRLVIPFGLLIWIGERVQREERARFHRV